MTFLYANRLKLCMRIDLMSAIRIVGETTSMYANRPRSCRRNDLDVCETTSMYANRLVCESTCMRIDLYAKRPASDDPIHILSVLVGPESFLKSSSSLKRVGTESMSERTAVVSSAYWSNFLSFLPIVMPFIVEFYLIAIAKISTATTKRYGESGSSWLTPRLIAK